MNGRPSYRPTHKVPTRPLRPSTSCSASAAQCGQPIGLTRSPVSSSMWSGSPTPSRVVPSLQATGTSPSESNRTALAALTLTTTAAASAPSRSRAWPARSVRVGRVPDCREIDNRIA